MARKKASLKKHSGYKRSKLLTVPTVEGKLENIKLDDNTIRPACHPPAACPQDTPQCYQGVSVPWPAPGSCTKWWTLTDSSLQIVQKEMKSASSRYAPLSPGEWLSGKLMDEITQRIVEHQMKIEKSDDVYGALSCLVSHKLNMGKEGRQLVATRRFRDRPVCGHRKIVVPLLISSSHWVLAVLDVPNQLLTYYDSFGSNPIDCLEFCLLRDFFSEVLHCSLKVVLPTGHSIAQWNGCDCGVFACLFGLYDLLQKEVDFSCKYTEKDLRHWLVLLLISACT